MQEFDLTKLEKSIFLFEKKKMNLDSGKFFLCFIFD